MQSRNLTIAAAICYSLLSAVSLSADSLSCITVADTTAWATGPDDGADPIIVSISPPAGSQTANAPLISVEVVDESDVVVGLHTVTQSEDLLLCRGEAQGSPKTWSLNWPIIYIDDEGNQHDFQFTRGELEFTVVAMDKAGRVSTSQYQLEVMNDNVDTILSNIEADRQQAVSLPGLTLVETEYVNKTYAWRMVLADSGNVTIEAHRALILQLIDSATAVEAESGVDAGADDLSAMLVSLDANWWGPGGDPRNPWTYFWEDVGDVYANLLLLCPTAALCPHNQEYTDCLGDAFDDYLNCLKLEVIVVGVKIVSAITGALKKLAGAAGVVGAFSAAKCSVKRCEQCQDCWEEFCGEVPAPP